VAIPEEDEMTDVTVREGERTVWEKGHFVDGTPGVTSGTPADARVMSGAFQDRRVIFEVGSGHYIFRLTGQ
jgi:hypothetical protein